MRVQMRAVVHELMQLNIVHLSGEPARSACLKEIDQDLLNDLQLLVFLWREAEHLAQSCDRDHECVATPLRTFTTKLFV